MVEKTGDASQFSILVSSAQFYRLLSVYSQQPVGQSRGQPQHHHRLCLDSVVVRPEGHSGSAGGTTVVPDVPAARPC